MSEVDVVSTYQRIGAVVLRNVISTNELELLRNGVEEVLSCPSRRAQEVSDDFDKEGRFFEDFERWPDCQSLENFVRNTRLSRIGATLMQSSTATLYHDHILVKEPGTTARTPYHQDQPYYDVEGTKTISFWIPLDLINAETSLEVVPSTHSGPWYLPTTFKSGEKKWFPPGSLPECPSFNHQTDILRWTLEPGDAIAFHFLAVHGAPGVSATAPRRRVYSLRLLGDDCTYIPRPWIPSPDLHPILAAFPGGHPPLQPGAALTGPLFPTLFHCPINLQTYPIIGAPSALAGLVGRLRADFLRSGAVVLPRFLTDKALEEMAAEVAAAAPLAFVSRDGHNVYLDSGDPSLPPEHPRNVRVRTVVGSIAYDL